MSLVVKSLYDGILGAALADTYVPGALTKAQIWQCDVYNGTGAAVALVVQVLTATAGTLRTVLSRTLSPNETYLCPELVNLTLNVGGKVQMSGLGMVVVLSGKEFS
jgi:hypothetical protein